MNNEALRFKDLALSKRVIEQLRYTQTFNKGFWLGAKIYSDQRGNCKCGGSFTARELFKKLEYPVCNKCGEEPRLFRIRAKVVTLGMEEKYVDIRHLGHERLVDIVDVFRALKQVEAELESGTFDLRKYDSKQSRESYLFSNYVEDYLEFHQNRLKVGELSPSGFANKKTAINKLLPLFKDKDISTFKRADIERFKNQNSDFPRARDLALAELKSILKHAADIDELPVRVPKFDLIPSSKKRKEIISLDDALKVIDEIEDPQYRFMLRLLTIYPVRPGELRALQWRDIDYFGNEVTFQRHFSRDVLIDGRKSIKDGDKAEVKFPLTEMFKAYLHTIARPLKKDAFIFTGKEQAHVSDKCLSRAWRKATRKLKMPDYDLYEMRHARLSQMAEQSNGDTIKLLQASGHTNLKTVSERYIRTSADLSEFFQ